MLQNISQSRMASTGTESWYYETLSYDIYSGTENNSLSNGSEEEPTIDPFYFPQPSAIHSVVDLVLMSVFLVIGTVGNMLVILVYLRNTKRKQSTANHFLCSLAITDFTVCIIVVPMHIYFEIMAMHRRITASECKAIMVIWHQTLICSSWILVGISIDRFYSLCRPFDMRIHSRMVRKIIICIWVMSVLVAFPAVFYYGASGCRFTVKVGSPMRIFLAIGQASITLILPLTVIGMNYLRIFSVLSKRNRHAQHQLGRCRVMNQTRLIVAKRLLLVIAVFIICWLPRTILEIYHSFVHEDPQVMKVLIVYICRNILPYLNSVLNPLLYSMINPSFRHECWDILCCRYNRRRLLRANSIKNGSASRRTFNRQSSYNDVWL
ncbi:neuromedin-U receptor 2-like [Lytechinus variegatus]|uniref:neuromedin-U receptor 2-like n=1 Tax=Lytechinus variegatus TaxID=7654 RepID=UPI001BB110BC|nr:neuromedin-U receptor 2-like [Lytechinus variegatus]